MGVAPARRLAHRRRVERRFGPRHGEGRAVARGCVAAVGGAFQRRQRAMLVASSMNTSKVHCGPRPSNHQCSDPSICTSSPRQARRGRGWNTRGRRSLRRSQSPSAIIHCRSVSTPSGRPCSSSSFSAASVGPKSAYRSRTKPITVRRSVAPWERLLGRPRLRDTKPIGP